MPHSQLSGSGVTLRPDFQQIFDASPNAYMVLDRDLRYVAANPAYLRATGRSIDELMGRRLFEVFPNDPDDPSNESARLLRDSLQRVLETKQPDVIAFIPYRIERTVDGISMLEEHFWSATHTPLLDDSGNVSMILQHTVNVTELHRLQQMADADATVAPTSSQLEAGVLDRAQSVQVANVMLDHELRNLRRVFEQAPGFVAFVSGPDHVFQLANHAYEQLIGPRPLLGRSVKDALPEVGPQGYIDVLDQVYRTGEPFVAEERQVLLQRQPGATLEELVLDFVFQPITDGDGRVFGIFILGHDITALKRLETRQADLLASERTARAAAEAARERQRFLAESIPQQVWTADPAGALTFVNTRVLEYFDARPGDVLGSAWQRAVHPDDLPGALQRWEHSLSTGSDYEAEFRLRRADGTYRWHLARALALRNGAGAIEAWFGTNTDMDEFRRAQNALRERSEFEQQIIGIVSHDLRNPINAIGIAASLLLRRGQLDDQQGKVVARIVSSSERARRMIRDFLDFAQARSSGRLPVSLGPANVRQIARQVFDEVHLAFIEREASLVHEGEETGHWDADRISQVIANLLSNAFQHGAPDVPVRLTTRGSADAVVIEVRNGGAPIPGDALGRLFEPFQRGDGAAATPERSVGLGLYIARQIVTAHGGSIDVRSTAAEGTTFVVRLPRSTPVSDTPSAPPLT